jgi:hypothetical protein
LEPRSPRSPQPLAPASPLKDFSAYSSTDELGLTQEVQRAITLLQERRTALISAAVTGKIDVRAWQPPVGSQMETITAETN